MRVAYANVRGGALCLGDPGGRHVRLLVDGVEGDPYGVLDAQGPGTQGESEGLDAGLAPGDELPDDDLTDDEYEDEYTGEDDEYDDDPDADGPDDDQREPRGFVAWADLAALEIDAPTTRWRYPGVLSTVVAAVVGTVGIDWYPSGAELDVEITTGSGVEVVRCDGFAGRGYWAPHARAVEALLRLLLSDRGARDWLDTPADLLAVVASVARSGPTDEALVDELRVLLAPGPRVG